MNNPNLDAIDSLLHLDANNYAGLDYQALHALQNRVVLPITAARNALANLQAAKDALFNVEQPLDVEVE